MSGRRITVVGLGPGAAELLTGEARALLTSGLPVVLRTRIHPTVAELPGTTEWPSYDHLYELAENFGQLYRRIVDDLLERASARELIYAVPGHPLFAEATVRELLARAPALDVSVRVTPGISFVDTAVAALGLDPVAAGLQLVDALDLADWIEREPFGGGSLPLSALRPALVAQLYSQPVASGAKLALLSLYPAETPVTVLTATGSRAAAVEVRPLSQLDHGSVDHLTSAYLPAVDPLASSRTADGLQQIVARLRSPAGCPWDREQTHESLVKFLIEESYEAADALERLDPAAMEEELGDVLLQIFLHAQLAEESGAFTLNDVYQAVAGKLVRRHPHVFGDACAETPGDVLRTWDAVKAEEKRAPSASDAARTKPLGDVPASLPALARAQTLIHRARRLDIYDEATLAGGPAEETLLVGAITALVAAADEQGIDAEQVLRRWTQRFERQASQRWKERDGDE